MQYNNSTTHRMCVTLDYPPVSSAIIWARQVEAPPPPPVPPPPPPPPLFVCSAFHSSHSPPFTQIDRQLQTYLQRVEAVLGKGWESHVEGQKLKQDGDSFRQKLNTQQLFDDWKKKVEARQLIVQGRIFNIMSQRTRTGTILKLQVNFTPETITLAKEVSWGVWRGVGVGKLWSVEGVCGCGGKGEGESGYFCLLCI